MGHTTARKKLAQRQSRRAGKNEARGGVDIYYLPADYAHVEWDYCTCYERSLCKVHPDTSEMDAYDTVTKIEVFGGIFVQATRKKDGKLVSAIQLQLIERQLMAVN